MSLTDPMGVPMIPVNRQVMPPLSPSERSAMRESIRRFGVLVPIVVDQNGAIIDGHNRSVIADELLVSCPSEIVIVRDEAHAQELAASLNLDRRHMDEITRAAVARSLREAGHSLRATARALGVSHEQVRQDLKAEEAIQVSTDLTPESDVSGIAPAHHSDGDQPAASTPDRVTGDDGKSYPTKRRQWTAEAFAELLELSESGKTGIELAEIYGLTAGAISNLLAKARKLGETQQFNASNPPSPNDKSRNAIAARRHIIAEMAEEGHDSRQISKTLQIADVTVRRIAANEHIEIPADKITSNTRRLNHDRIVGETVATLEALTQGISLVDFEELDPAQVAAWAESLRSSINTLKRFHKELTK